MSMAVDGNANSDRTGGVTAPTPPLTTSERAEALSYLGSSYGLNESQARKLLDRMSPDQARTFLNLISGMGTISRADAQRMWNLKDSELNLLFPKGERIGVLTNPFAKAFLNYLILSYSLGLDIRQMMAKIIETQIQLGIEKANQIFNGAIVQFACAMTAAVLTGVMGGVGLYKATHPPKQNKDMTPEERAAADRKAAMDNQWYSPIGASLMTQPINAGGEFGKQWYEREGALTAVEAEEAEKLYQQMLSFYQSTMETDQSVARAV